MTIKKLSLFQLCFISACILGALSIACDALASHLPINYFSTPQGREHLHTAATMALWHSIFLITLCLNIHRLPFIRTLFISLGFLLGILCFSFSVGLHALGFIKHAPLAPIGGSILIIAWLSLLTLLPSIKRTIITQLSQNKDS